MKAVRMIGVGQPLQMQEIPVPEIGRWRYTGAGSGRGHLPFGRALPGREVACTPPPYDPRP